MKKFKRVVLCLVSALLIGLSSISNITSFANTIETTSEIFADIIEWRYKIENNKLYRRQYNCSTQKWIGNWEFVANVS